MGTDPLSQEAIEAIFKGQAPQGSAHPEFAKIAHLVASAQSAPTSAELSGEHMTVAAFMANQVPVSTTGGKSKVLKLLSAKAAAVAAAVVLTGGAAAAFTGSLVSFHGSRPTTTPVTTQVVTQTDNGTPVTSSTVIPNENQGMASGHSLYGLCTAYAAQQNHASTTTTSSTPTGGTTLNAFAQLQALATAEHFSSVSALCANYQTPMKGSSSGSGKASTPGVTAPGMTVVTGGHKPSSIPPAGAGAASSMGGSRHS